MGLLRGYVLWMIAIITVYLALPGLQAAMITLLGLTGAVAIAIGLSRERVSAPTAPSLLLAAASLSYAVTGAIVWLSMAGKQPQRPPTVSWYDASALARYLLLAAALWLFARLRWPRDRRNIIDAVTVAIGVAMMLWIFSALPHLLAPELSGEQRAVATAYPVVQIAVTLALARFATLDLEWSWPTGLIISGTACALVGSVTFGLLRANNLRVDWNVLNVSWMICFALIGLAALHSAAGTLTRPADSPGDEPSRARLIFLIAASVVAPVLTAFGHPTVRGTVISVSGTILTLGVLARLWTLDLSHMRRLEWERALHAAGPALASARSVEEIAGILRATSASIFGAGTGRGGGVFATLTGGELRVVTMSEVPGRPGRLLRTAREWLPLVLPLLATRVAAGDREPVYLPARRLAALIGPGDALKSGRDDVLLCPLAVSDHLPGDPLVGVFALVGGHWSRQSQRSLEIIASEVGLAMERVLLSQELVRRQSQEVFQALVRDTSDAILVIDEDDSVRYASPSAADIFGDVPVNGTNMRELAAASERGRPSDGPGASAAGNSRGDFDELWRITRHDGRTVLVLGRMSDLRADPAVRGRVWTLRDVTRERRLQDELHHRAFHDSLTGLANRMLFADRADHALSLTRRTGTVAAVMFMDLDDLKEVNDTRGHDVGDELLAEFGRRLTGVARESDTVARISGDEFALLAENLTDRADADIVADRVMAAFGDPFQLSQGEVSMTATVGVATSEDSDTVDELMRHADMALYAAKAAGKRRWQHYSPELSTSLRHRIEIRTALEEAITAGQFTLAYQPIVRLRTGTIAGFESLIRWPHPQWGMMMPGQFIGVAEDTGLIVPLGSWILGRAVTDAARLRDRAAGAPYISVNVAARQFRTAGFVTVVKDALESSGLPASALVLELTESSLLRRDGNIAAELAELKELGIRLAIDDFGTGYSSLSYLREMPIDVVKIDRSFVNGIEKSPERLALIKGIVSIAHTLEMSVIAEGVETVEQYGLLAEIGCEYGQGYLMAKPLEFTRAEDLLRSGQPLAAPSRAAPGPPA